MKINVLRHLLFPWVILFLTIIATIVGLGAFQQLYIITHPLFRPVIFGGILVCIYANFQTVSTAGIWIAFGIPKSRKLPSWNWFKETVIGVALVYSFFYIGQFAWTPIYWQGFIIPTISALGILIVLRGLLSPILSWCSQITFTRMASMILITPILLVMPLSAVYLGTMILNAYQISRPEPLRVVVNSNAPTQTGSPNPSSNKFPASTSVDGSDLENPSSERAQKLKAIALAKQICVQESANILSALSPRGQDEVVYWAIKSIYCSDIKRVISLTKLIEIMSHHPSSKIRATAIHIVGRYPAEEIRRIGYLLIKRMSAKEAPEVIEAAAGVLARQGPEEYLMTIQRMRDLLENSNLHHDVARIIMKTLRRDDIVIDYVKDNLGNTKMAEPHKKAISLICVLPNRERSGLTAEIPNIIASLSTGDNQDPAKLALECLGPAGFQAVQQEVESPHILNETLAAKTLAEMNIRKSQPALKTFEHCLAHSKSMETIEWCSHGLGKIGAPALPKIVELLHSKEEEQENIGEQALKNFDDPDAKQDLLKIRAENSGWSATQRKLKLARAIDTAILRLDEDKTAPQ